MDISLCKGRATKSSTTRRVEDDKLPVDWEEANYSSEEEDTVGRVEEVARMKIKPIKLEYERGFRPVQPPHFAIPYHYHDSKDKITHFVSYASPKGISASIYQEAVAMDPTYQKLVVAIRQVKRDQDPDLRPYRTVWGELGITDGLVCRGERIVLPDAELARDGGNIRDWGTMATQASQQPRDCSAQGCGFRAWTRRLRGGFNLVVTIVAC